MKIGDRVLTRHHYQNQPFFSGTIVDGTTDGSAFQVVSDHGYKEWFEADRLSPTIAAPPPRRSFWQFLLVVLGITR